MCACMQVAAYADHHVLVEKHMHADRPVTTFRELREGSERVSEVAAMMDLGVDVAGRLVAQAAQDIAHQRAAAAVASRSPALMAAAAAAGLSPPGEDGEPGALEQAGYVVDGTAINDLAEDGSSPAALQGSEHSALGSEPLRPA